MKERCFIILTSMMTDRRTNLTHDILVDIMTIKSNDKNWKEAERDELIDRAVQLYNRKRRSKQIDDGTNNEKTSFDEIEAEVISVNDDDDDQSDDDQSDNDDLDFNLEEHIIL